MTFRSCCLIYCLAAAMPAMSVPGAAYAQAATEPSIDAASHTSEARHGMVATVQPIAADAGVRVFREGGNAVDAAVAVALMLGVVDNHNSGLGGGCLILIRREDGQFVAIDGRETAPAAAKRDMYLRNGQPAPDLSQTGPLAVAVPGALAAYEMALDTCGTKPLAELLLPAAEVARKGFPIDAVYAGKLSRTAPILARFEGSRDALLKADDMPYGEGEILRQPDLARTYRHIAHEGTEWFYRGPFAKQVARWMASNGGIVTEADFAAYRAQRRSPIESEYRNYSIVGFPPPSSGGVHVAQVLNILENFDLAEMHRERPVEATHVLLEAMKRAFADRAHWLGDSDFVNVPRGLLNQQYADQLAEQIDLSQVTPVSGHGHPPHWKTEFLGGHTTHVAAADASGNWVAITATVNTAFGSKVIVPGTGVVLNNEMDDFSMQPGVPNAFGLIGAENNAIAAGKRPLSSMSPTIVLDEDGQPVLTVGAAGGPRIITQVILTIVRLLDYGMSLPEAVAAPRFHHQWLPDHTGVESTTSPALVAALKELGHQVEMLPAAGVTQAIGKTAERNLLGVHDPRVPGKAAGF